MQDGEGPPALEEDLRRPQQDMYLQQQQQDMYQQQQQQALQWQQQLLRQELRQELQEQEQRIRQELRQELQEQEQRIRQELQQEHDQRLRQEQQLQQELQQEHDQRLRQEQQLRQELKGQALTFGPKHIRNVAREVLLFACGNQPQSQLGGTTRFEIRARQRDQQLKTFLDLLHRSRMLPRWFTCQQLAANMDAIINTGNQAVHYATRAALEVDVHSARSLLQSHPRLQTLCNQEALVIHAYEMLKLVFQF